MKLQFLQNHFGIASSLSQIKKKIQDRDKIGSVGLVETQHFFFSALCKMTGVLRILVISLYGFNKISQDFQDYKNVVLEMQKSAKKSCKNL